MRSCSPGHIEHRYADFLDDLLGVVELLLLREMADVAGVDHKGRLGGHGLDLGYCLPQRRKRIRVGRLIETDVTVADLQEREGVARQGAGRLGAGEADRAW